MKEVVKKVYYCDFCKKKGLSKYAMVKHELFCNSKPENFPSCSGCSHLEQTEIEYVNFYFNGYNESESIRKTNGFRCKKMDKLLYPLKALRLGLPSKYPETFYAQELMPNKCEHREDELFDLNTNFF